MVIDLLSKNDVLLEACDVLQLQHDEGKFSIYAEILGDVALHPEDSLGFYDVDGKYRIFEIATRTLRQPDNVWAITGIDKGVLELMGDPIEEKRARNLSVNEYIERLLQGTRFTMVSTASGTGTMTAYYESVWSALVKVQEVYGVRCIPYYTITGGIITGRHVGVTPDGTNNRGRIFELGDDLTGIDITYDDSNIKTALYGRGQGVEIEGGDGSTDPAYGRRLTFADVVWTTAGGDPANKPLNQEWVGDPDALALYGRDGRHRFGFVVFDSTTDPDELLQQTWDTLQEQCVPVISINCTLRDTERILGRSHEAVRMYDTVMVRMYRAGHPIDITAKVCGIVRDYVHSDNTKITIGNELPSSGDIIQDLSTKVESYQDRAAVWDRANAFNIDGVMDVMNNQIKSTTGGWYTDPDTGAIMLVSTDGTKAMRLTGAGWQIASTKVAGAWIWRTAATGAGIVADQITSGIIQANLVKILGTDQFYWDSEAIRIIEPGYPNHQIRIGRYDGTNYGIGFTTDGGTTWTQSMNFQGVIATSIGVIRIATSQITGLISAKDTGISADADAWKLDFDTGTFTIGAINAGKIKAGSIDAERIAAHSLSVNKISGSMSAKDTGISADADAWKIDFTNGTITIGAINANKIKAGSIDAQRIAAESISLAKLTASSSSGDGITKLGNAGMEVAATSIGNSAKTSIKADGLKMYGATGTLIGGIMTLNGNVVTAMECMYNPSYPNFVCDVGQFAGLADAVYGLEYRYSGTRYLNMGIGFIEGSIVDTEIVSKDIDLAIVGEGGLSMHGGDDDCALYLNEDGSVSVKFVHAGSTYTVDMWDIWHGNVD